MRNLHRNGMFGGDALQVDHSTTPTRFHARSARSAVAVRTAAAAACTSVLICAAAAAAAAHRAQQQPAPLVVRHARIKQRGGVIDARGVLHALQQQPLGGRHVVAAPRAAGARQLG